jgi:hypothetical protein
MKMLGSNVIVLSLVAVALAAGQAPPPPAAPPAGDEGAKAKEIFTGLVQQGTNALMAGEHGAALGALLDAKQLFERKLRGKGPTVATADQVAMLHGLALAYQLNNRPEKASPLFDTGTPLDRACAAKGAPRQLLLTRAALDLTQGYLAMRTAVGLTGYLKEHPNELDSEILDVLFSALTKAEERVTNRTALDGMIKNYEEFNARLEATRPGQRRWGVEWVGEAVFKVNMRKRDAALREIDKAQGQLADANADVAKANDYLKWARGNGGSVSVANQRLSAAENRRATAQRALEDARAKLPPVPVLAKADLAKLVAPHEAQVVVAAKPAKSAKPGAPVQVASAEPQTKSIEFSLGGGGTSGTKVSTPGNNTAAGDVGAPSDPPARNRSRAFNRTATGFAIGPDLLLTAASAVKDAKRVVVEFPNAVPIEAKVERSGTEGLALLRLTGQRMAYVNPAEQFPGGPVQCPAYPEVSVFGVAVEVIKGRALALQDEGWKVSLSKHPRLPGAPVLDSAGDLVGVEMAEREDLLDKLPALSLKAVRGFVGSDLPGQPCANPKGAAVVQVTGTFER